MSWLRLDDSFPNHPKVSGLSHAAFRLHVSALCFCAQNATDGLVLGRSLGVIGAISGRRTRTVLELETALLWRKVPDGWIINGFLDYNPSKAETEARRRVGKENAERRWKGAKPNATGNAIGIGDGSAKPNAFPSPPSPVLSLPPFVASHVGVTGEGFKGSSRDQLLALASNDEDRAKITRAAKGLPEVCLVNALSSALGPDVRDPLGAALARLKQQRTGGQALQPREAEPEATVAPLPAKCPTCGVKLRNGHAVAEHLYNSHGGPVPEHYIAAEAAAGLASVEG